MSMNSTADAIEALARPIAQEQLRQRPGGGGMSLDYIDWPVAVDRLNEAVGTDNWDLTLGEVTFLGDAQSGYAVCRGQLTVRFPDGTSSTKGQFGGCAYGQQTGRGMTPDDAAKGAGSDALKKCAALFGVALDLSRKEPQVGGFSGNGYGNSNGGYGRQQSTGNFTQGQAQGGGGVFEGDDLACEECGEALTETRFKDGTAWGPAQLAAFGRRKHGRVLCMSHYREANQSKRRAEEALQQVPF